MNPPSRSTFGVGLEAAAGLRLGGAGLPRLRVGGLPLSLAAFILSLVLSASKPTHTFWLSAEALQTRRGPTAFVAAPGLACDVGDGESPSRRLRCSRGSDLTSLAASRRPFVGGNWKCNGTVAEAERIVAMLNDAPEQVRDVDVVVAPPSLHASFVRRALRHPFSVAIQNVGAVPGYGAYTGELCSEMIKDAGFDSVLVGHSERRAGFGGQAGEGDSVVARKAKRAVDSGLNVIACIGETLEARQGGQTLEVLSRQLRALAESLEAKDWKRVVVAYEPVWAIGTGKTATPELAQETHKEIREWIRQNVGADVAEETRIIYGGSVKGSNAKELFARPDIDGFLVGGASLKEDFLAIISAARQTKA